jgi:hypothetical protein
LPASATFLHLLFAADCVVVGIAAWLLACVAGNTAHRPLEAAIAWGWWCVAIVAGAATVAGAAGIFNLRGFGACHVATAIVAGLIRRRTLATDFAALGRHAREMRGFLLQRRAEAIGAWAVIAIVAALAAIALFAEPAVYDALCYHLPRVGQWLQDGRVGFLPSADERVNFVAALPELVMAWLVSGTSAGFRPCVLLQAIGGALAVASTFGLARKTGLNRFASIATAGLLFGMQNVVAQFTTAQTDLFTAGVFAAAFYLGWCALDRGESSPVAGLGFGLALAAKGTVFYLVPGVALWVLVFAWRYRPAWRTASLTAAWGIAGILFFAGPGFWRNYAAYGNALGPRAWVEKVHRPAGSASALAHKFALNAASTLTQNFAASAQPFGLGGSAAHVGLSLVQRLPNKDDFTLEGERRATLAAVVARENTDADATAFGLVGTLLFVGGVLIAAVAGGRPGRGRILAWAAGLIVFFAFYSTMQQWHPFGFRYFVLVSPWVAIVGGWAIEQLPRLTRRIAWALVLVAAANVAIAVTANMPFGGWAAATHPERGTPYAVASRWRTWSETLNEAAPRFVIALPTDRPIAAFYRQTPPRAVALRPEIPLNVPSAEAVVGGSDAWLIVPVSRFIGREGNVVARVSLFQGDESSPFSLAAYRAPRAGEVPAPVMYRHIVTQHGPTFVHDLLVKTWPNQSVHVTLAHPGGPATYEIVTPAGARRGSIATGPGTTVGAELEPEAVSQVRIVIRNLETEPTPTDATVEISR